MDTTPTKADEDESTLSIYEKLVFAERRAEAEALGIPLGELEESRALQNAIEDTKCEGNATTRSDVTDAGVNLSLHDLSLEEPGEDNASYSSNSTVILDSASMIFSSTPQADGAIDDVRVPNVEEENSVIWDRLPAEMAIQVHAFVGDVDMFGVFALLNRSIAASARVVYTAPTPGLFMVREVMWKQFCEQTFPRQFASLMGLERMKLPTDKFSSWKDMAIMRPRIRTNGFYSVRTMYSRAPSNDCFWEERRTKSVEVQFYRHFRFYNDGNLLYSLSTTDPWESPFHKMLPVPKKVFSGKYVAKGRNVSVSIDVGYSVLSFEMDICNGNESYSQYAGNHSVLRLKRHTQVLEGSGSWELPLPINCDLRFFRQWNWAPNTFLQS